MRNSDRRSTRERLPDILEAIDLGRAAAGTLGLEAFSKSGVNRYAAERAIEVISEASRHIPLDLKAHAPNIPWQDVADIGNVLRHLYERVDPEIIWSAVQKDFGPLESATRAILASLPEDG